MTVRRDLDTQTSTSGRSNCLVEHQRERRETVVSPRAHGLNGRGTDAPLLGQPLIQAAHTLHVGVLVASATAPSRTTLSTTIQAAPDATGATPSQKYSGMLGLSASMKVARSRAGQDSRSRSAAACRRATQAHPTSATRESPILRLARATSACFGSAS